MPIRNEDYRPYMRGYNGRGYRIYRIFLNNLLSMLKSKWTIIVMSLSFLFLFFSVLEIVFSAPIEEAQSEIMEDQLSEVYFDIVPLDQDDLDVVAHLNSTFEISYRITNVGRNDTFPFYFMLMPNEHWEAQYDMALDVLGPGGSIQVDVRIRVPGAWDNFSYLPTDKPYDEEPEKEEDIETVRPLTKNQMFDPNIDIGSLVPSGPNGASLASLSSPYDLFPNAQMYRNDITRSILFVVMPGDVDLQQMLSEKGLSLDPRISSLASLVSIDPADCGLPQEYLARSSTPSFEMKILDGKERPFRRRMTSQDYEEIAIVVRNVGNETLRLRMEALIMPIADPAWYVDIWSTQGFGAEPDRGLAPGEEMVYMISISSGYLQMRMPYNILILGTDITNQYYQEASVEHVIIDVTGPPKVLSLEEKLYRTFWGGGFNYERFLWVILLTAVCGSGLIANDLKNNTLTLYLSRPITWVDYAVGKSLALATLISFITLLPAFIVFVTRMAFVNESFSYILGHLWLLGGMLLAYIVAMVMFTSIAVALSSLTKRGIFAGVGIFGYFIFAPLVSDIMADIFDSDMVKLVNINLMMKNLIKPLFGISYDQESMGFGYEYVVLVCTLLVLASWAAVYLRFNRREVAK